MTDILIVEDDPAFGELLMMHLEDLGHQVVWHPHLAGARQHLSEHIPDLILLDQQLPDGFGLDLLIEIKQPETSPPVIMLTGASGNQLVIEAMKAGAYDFIRKPMDELTFDTTLQNALSNHRLSRKVALLTAADDYQVDVTQIIGTCPAMTTICKTIGSIAPRPANALITGESGTGKEVVARAIHHHSGRDGLFLAVNCSALVESLIESELFGHEKGAFTGADRQKAGKFELAVDGTLFLDELGELPLTVQAKLLRVLQEGTFERVGGSQTLHSNARIIAATNRNLELMIQAEQFREDLYYRLNVINIHLPPLRERITDLPLLVEHLLRKINSRTHTRIDHLTEACWRELEDYRWPGNIRELENVLTRAAILCRGGTLTPDLLVINKPAEDPSLPHSDDHAPLVTLAELEAQHIQRVLTHTRWHKGKSCELLGISRPALDRKIDKYHLNET